MTSQLDLDQGGISRAWVKIYMGPSVGWVNAPAGNVLPITAAGIYSIDYSTSLVEVNVAAAVTIILPSAILPTPPAGVNSGRFVGNPITIVDKGGHAQLFPITIQPFSGGETIMGLTQIQITINYASFALLPLSDIPGYVSVPQ